MSTWAEYKKTMVARENLWTSAKANDVGAPHKTVHRVVGFLKLLRGWWAS